MYRLLIVDDEMIIANGLAKLFRAQEDGELEIYTAYSAEEAISIVKATPIDIILSDIRMPEKDGLAMFDDIVACRPSCRFIFLTGYSDFDYIYSAIQKNIDGYLLKSETFETIAETVNKAVSKIKETSFDIPPVAPSEDTETAEEEESLIELIHRYVQNNLAGDLSLVRIAEALYFHPSYLSRTYKQATGRNISHYIQNAKTEEAVRLLAHTQLKVQEIALKLGFETPSYFTAFFKKMKRVSPQEYREELAAHRMRRSGG